jgi:hypothetical protein
MLHFLCRDNPFSVLPSTNILQCTAILDEEIEETIGEIAANGVDNDGEEDEDYASSLITTTTTSQRRSLNDW